MLLDIQKKINHLLYCYYTIIGVIQRDCHKEEIDETTDLLLEQLKNTKGEIEEMINNKLKERKEETKQADINIEEINRHINDGKYFIDYILKQMNKIG